MLLLYSIRRDGNSQGGPSSSSFGTNGKEFIAQKKRKPVGQGEGTKPCTRQQRA